MFKLTQIIFFLIASSPVFGINLTHIHPERELYQGEYIHFIWESEVLQCTDVSFKMLNSQNQTAHEFTCEREPGFCKTLMPLPCLPSGRYRFELSCGGKTDISRTVQLASASNNLDFYTRGTNLLTWNFIRAPIQLNISIFSQSDMTLLKTQTYSVEESKETSQIEFTMEDNKEYIMKGYDMCGFNIGESKVFSKTNPLEQERTNPNPTPSPSPSPSPSSGPSTEAPTPEPTEKSDAISDAPYKFFILIFLALI